MFTNDDIVDAIAFYDTQGDHKVGIKQVMQLWQTLNK